LPDAEALPVAKITFAVKASRCRQRDLDAFPIRTGSASLAVQPWDLPADEAIRRFNQLK
jgi:hypothetical protein